MLIYLHKLIVLLTATIRKSTADLEALNDMGLYISACLPKYVQNVQITSGDELEVMVCPDGLTLTLEFLREHHNTQFGSLSDLTALDVPSRAYRFEVRICYN